MKKSSANISAFITAIMTAALLGTNAKADGFSTDDSVFLNKLVTPPERLDQSKNLNNLENSRSSTEELLRDRTAEYELIRKQAERDGTLGGALRGALIGGVFTGEVAGIVGGAVLGAVAGSYTSKNIAGRIIADHQNYSMRKWSLERVIEAAKLDSENTEFDLLLTRNYFKQDLQDGRVKPSNEVMGDISLLAENATIRMLSIHEICPLFAEHSEVLEGLEAELAKQQSFVNEFNDILESVK